MKTILFAFCFFCVTSCATSAFAQVGSSISSVAQPLEFADHPSHASQHDMGQEQSLLSSPSITYAQGERPLWEFGPISQPVPLGDIARAYRKEHAYAKKAEVIFNK
jgi:hypothetical protein